MCSRVARALAGALLLGSSLASCGGDGDDRLTRKQLAARGNAICAESDEKLRAVFAEELSGEGEPTGEQMQAVLRRAVPIFGSTVRRLEALHPPESVEDRFEGALKEAEEALGLLRRGAADPTVAEKVFSSPQDPFEEANQRLESLGITRCSQGAGDAGGPGEAGSPGTGVGAATFRASEYEFAAPATLAAGKVTIILSNRGNEPHELDVARLKEGVTAQQVVDAEAAGRDAVELVADEDVGHVGPLGAGATGQAEVTLVPGTYVFACFVDAPDGQPHVAKGMFGEFNVP